MAYCGRGWRSLPSLPRSSKGSFFRVDARQLRPIWTSPGYCHCVFTALADFPEDLGQRWTDTLLAMRYGDPRWRELMDLEGLKQWIRADPAILEGYRVLFEAVEEQGSARDGQS